MPSFFGSQIAKSYPSNAAFFFFGYIRIMHAGPHFFICFIHPLFYSSSVLFLLAVCFVFTCILRFRISALCHPRKVTCHRCAYANQQRRIPNVCQKRGYEQRAPQPDKTYYQGFTSQTRAVFVIFYVLFEKGDFNDSRPQTRGRGKAGCREQYKGRRWPNRQQQPDRSGGKA